MSTLPYLTDAEIREIACPLSQPAAIVRWFKQNGYTIKVKPNGMPLVNRANFDAVSSGGTSKAVEETQEQPDVSGYLSRLAKRSKSRAHA